jgi:ubiquinone/menaquinone biosynthesis C-methylase UbiE
MMKEKVAIQEAFGEMSPRYEEVVDGELNLFWGWSYKGFVEELVNQTPFQIDQKILDIATGTSVIPRKILGLNIPGIQITGQDISEAMLRRGKKSLSGQEQCTFVDLACSDAMALPFKSQSFDVVVSGLSSHHMDIHIMLSEMKRVLKPGGLLSLIDVGTSNLWEKPIFKLAGRVFAFFYFLIKENPSRAWAEAAAVNNLRTPEGWEIDLHQAGFHTIEIKKLCSKYRWVPEPLSIKSINHLEENS